MHDGKSDAMLHMLACFMMRLTGLSVVMLETAL